MQLDVRDRRIEAKIAYIGASGAGKATNFSKLGGETTGDSLSVDWRPPTPSRFRDCDVVVKLVAERGAPDAARLTALLRDVDGVVLVADSDPSTHRRSSETLELTRATLSSLGRNDVPVLVQINKRDVDGAPSPVAVLEAIGGSGLPHVEATASRGEGVVETAERALEAVLASAAKGDAPSVGEGKLSARALGNPLLTALRQILRETVSEHLEERRARDADAFAQLARQIAELRASVEGLAERERATRSTPAPPASRESVARALDTLTERVGAQHEIAARTAQKVAELLEELNQDTRRSKWGWFR